MSNIVAINMFPRTTECIVCDDETGYGYSLAMYEDQIVPDDATDWGGSVCCKECYDRNLGHVGYPLPAPEQEDAS